ncbi:MAG: hypothetical protein LUC50_06745, partial [Ruminococcus sp.]|nr:hypothetical protein [Ruminococcus sp.]
MGALIHTLWCAAFCPENIRWSPSEFYITSLILKVRFYRFYAKRKNICTKINNYKVFTRKEKSDII